MIDHIAGQTFHARRGHLKHAFKYSVDFVLADLPLRETPRLLSANRFNLWHLSDRHHGGPRGAGRGVDWFRELLAARKFPLEGAQLVLLTQPSFLWFEFNPVSFWIALRDGAPCAFVAEVNSTFGQRHCYFCAHDDFRPIQRTDRLSAQKLMHVSPFQKIEGQYHFNFDLTDEAVDIRIAYENGKDGVIATLSGPRRPATNASLARAALARPLGAARVLALIHWQAIFLYVKRAPFLKRQPAPETLVSDGHGAPEAGQ
ncbi:DUF1365 domain-containing protein [Tropicimonas sp. TH_r6]|uniref:DUF1365 domain-containing protein n=1 Tax=Tropicimonas sp. TH_r6 TaxID=3082085 RepID=UPI00295485D1|nr:DUF1365 domain-containing protein [Tropicimonas sp. TH_r6]MDV7144345.1 DUF1365 domain-containing protein [Tropicimonas sp. TH_r6]